MTAFAAAIQAHPQTGTGERKTILGLECEVRPNPLDPDGRNCLSHGGAFSSLDVVGEAGMSGMTLEMSSSSRYVTFEAITHNDAQGGSKAPAALAGEVRRRFFSHAAAPIKTSDMAGNFPAHQNLFWRGPAGGAPIADFGDDVTVSFGPGNAASSISGAMSCRPTGSSRHRAIHLIRIGGDCRNDRKTISSAHIRRGTLQRSLRQACISFKTQLFLRLESTGPAGIITQECYLSG